jgi:hypothetical protein
MREAIVEPSGPIAASALPLGRFLDGPSSSIRLERRTLLLEVRSPGRLVPWIGPAIRGITALRYRASVCRQPREEWTGRWQHCRGCPHLPECGYGIAFEPEARAPSASPIPADVSEGPVVAENLAGSMDAVRRLVIAPGFPAITAARRGHTFEVRITSIGPQASASVPGIIAAIADAGLRDGLGPDRVRFAIADTRPAVDTLVIDPARLPALPMAGPTLPRLTIRLTAPLFLRERESRNRRTILAPDFQTFVRHSVRIIREFFPGLRIGPANGHDHAAARVALAASDLAIFRQEKASRRTFQRFEMEGVVGSITFADVPGCFLPWLALAGILHVGGHRVAGAGGWTVHTEQPPRPAAPGNPR